MINQSNKWFISKILRKRIYKALELFSKIFLKNKNYKFLTFISNKKESGFKNHDRRLIEVINLKLRIIIRNFFQCLSW